jgi:hypothetical protein
MSTHILHAQIYTHIHAHIWSCAHMSRRTTVYIERAGSCTIQERVCVSEGVAVSDEYAVDVTVNGVTDNAELAEKNDDDDDEDDDDDDDDDEKEEEERRTGTSDSSPVPRPSGVDIARPPGGWGWPQFCSSVFPAADATTPLESTSQKDTDDNADDDDDDDDVNTGLRVCGTSNDEPKSGRSRWISVTVRVVWVVCTHRI